MVILTNCLKKKRILPLFFCGNDLIAFGAVKAIKENGFRVPEDISVIGYDDIKKFLKNRRRIDMRLGGPVFTDHSDPEGFALAHKAKGYSAALCPDGLMAGEERKIREYKESLRKHNIVPAEVGAWCNMLDKDPAESKKNIDFVIERLTLADELEANVCVNIMGSWCAEFWYGPAKANWGEEFFDYAVEVSRKIIDAVKPGRTKMTFEIMPFSFLDGAAEYLRFLWALDRPKYAAVHFDPINCINSPRVYFENKSFLAQEFALLGPNTYSMHLKDLAIRYEPPSVMFDEVPIGTGGINYVALLKEIGKLPVDMPCMLEHLGTEEEYDKAAEAVRRFAAEAGVAIL